MTMQCPPASVNVLSLLTTATGAATLDTAPGGGHWAGGGCWYTPSIYNFTVSYQLVSRIINKPSPGSGVGWPQCCCHTLDPDINIIIMTAPGHDYALLQYGISAMKT